jgi:glucosyl-dolichyl phosphate glucuronosyltransferase
MKNLRVSVIIPTKNRPSELQRAVRSVLAQTVAHLSLVIVDQSPDNEGLRLVEAEVAAAKMSSDPLWNLNYIHDTRISGGAMARNRAMKVADGDIWLFLDDDVTLERDFVEQLLAVYRDYPEAVGVSGIITNYPCPPLAFRLWTALFMRGPFHDERQPIYWRAESLRSAPPLPVRKFTGALMSFRADTVLGKFFDENLHGVSDGEDVDFCTQLDRDTQLFIAPGARLEHHHSPGGRLRDHWLRRSVRGNIFLYRKNWNEGIFNRCCYLWLMVGYSAVALVASLRRLSLDPCRALKTGLDEAHYAVPDSESKGFA